MERIRVTGSNGIVEMGSTSGEAPFVAWLLVAEGRDDIAIEVDADSALKIVPTLIGALSTLAAAETNRQALVEVAGWHVELASGQPHQPMLHALLDQGARLSFALHPDHLRPLAQLLNRKADELEAMKPPPIAPGSAARN